jgi:hypothetical protein
MIRLLQWLLFGHIHEWKIESRNECQHIRTGERWTRYYLQCKTCGIVKIKDPTHFSEY